VSAGDVELTDELVVGFVIHPVPACLVLPFPIGGCQCSRIVLLGLWWRLGSLWLGLRL
jgi:hypothetical protein